MDFDFFMPVKVIGGKNAVLFNENVFSRYGKKCLIVTGKNSAKLSGALEDITAVLDNIGCEYTLFDKITQNPRVADCHEAGQLARDFSVDFIIGVGGGSALDAAKAAAVFAANKHLEPEMIYSDEPVLHPLPLILVGTTAGTGSEVTGVSVLTRENGKKKSVSGENYYAAVALADPKYTYSVPYKYTVSTAIDAFSHASESFFSNKSNDNSRLFAEKALVPLWNAVKYFYETSSLPNEDLRDTLYYSSIYAGMALNITGTCFPHTMGYALTEDFSVSHGFACAAFLPDFVSRAMQIRNDLSMEYFSLLGTNFPEFEKIIKSVIILPEIKMNAQQIDSYCSNWSQVKNFKNSPGGFNADDAKQLLTKMFM